MKYFLIFVPCLLLFAGAVSGFTPVVYPGKVSSECVHDDPLQDEQLMEAIRQAHQRLGPPGCNPPRNRSCQEIIHCFPSASSGYYQIHAPNGSLLQVYCDMEGTNCGNITGWTRVAYLNMTQPNATCPPALERKDTNAGLALCYKRNAGCDSTVYSTLGLSYSQVCGQIRGYQYGTPDAFDNVVTNPTININEPYADGVSITYGSSPRKHLWTYTGGVSPLGVSQFNCPCNDEFEVDIQLPSFIGDDYYCESGAVNHTATGPNVLQANDILWDGMKCIGREGPCCTDQKMPWFIKLLSQTTTEDIEMRLCTNRGDSEDTPLELVELFVR